MSLADPELAAAQQGDEAAFAALCNRYSSRLERILLRLTGDETAAQEALQNALIRAWRNLGRFEGRSGFFTWLARIALNEGYRTLGRADRKRELPLDDAVGERIPSWGSQPEEVFETREFLTALSGALDRLPEDHRIAVILRDVEGLSTTETAEVLEIGEAALKSRLHRGRMALRRELDGFFTTN